MTARAIRFALAAMLGAWLATPALAAEPACAMTAADRAWIEGALRNWRVSERAILKLDPQPLPTIYAIDAHCTFIAKAGGEHPAWQGTPHGETIRFPGGNEASIGPISFASSGDGDPYFAMSLPSVWRAAGVESPLGLERLMEGVMLHELMHARQFYFVNSALDAISKHAGLGDDLTDDSIQDRFESDPAYRAAYEKERDLLFAAAAAPTDAEARQRASEALASMRARRGRWLGGGEAHWAELDDIFLSMEGLGQWLAYAWFVSPQGAKIAPAAALPAVRRGGKQWSQDEGLALFLVIDRLVPDWQRLAFAPEPLLAEALLERAAKSPERPDDHAS